MGSGQGRVVDARQAGVGQPQTEVLVGVVVQREALGSETDPKTVLPPQRHVATPQPVQDSEVPLFDCCAVAQVLLAVENGTDVDVPGA